MKVPRELELVRDVEDRSEYVRNSELLLASKTGAKIAQADYAIVEAQRAADAAQAAAAAALPIAAYAQGQADAAYAAAGSAYNQAVSAAGAAATANSILAVVEQAEMYIADPVTPNPILPPNAWTAIQEMNLYVPGGLPLLVFFSCEINSSIGTGCDIGIFENGVLNGQSYRQVTVYEATPNPVSIVIAMGVGGDRTIQARWFRGSGSAWSPEYRRQLSVLRMGVP